MFPNKLIYFQRIIPHNSKYFQTFAGIFILGPLPPPASRPSASLVSTSKSPSQTPAQNTDKDFNQYDHTYHNDDMRAW